MSDHAAEQERVCANLRAQVRADLDNLAAQIEAQGIDEWVSSRLRHMASDPRLLRDIRLADGTCGEQ